MMFANDSYNKSLIEPFIDKVDELSLDVLHKLLAKQHDDYIAVKLVTLFCIHCQTEENKRVALEFLYMNGLYEELEQVIEQNKQLSPRNATLAYIYTGLLERRRNTLSTDTLINRFKLIKTDDPEILSILTLLKVYLHYEKREYGMLGYYLDTLEDQLSKIESTVMTKYLEMRKKEMLFYYHWKRNEVIIARKYGFQLINQNQNALKKSQLLVALSQTYIYESYKKAMSYSLHAKEYAERYGFTSLANSIKNKNIPFISAFHNETKGVETTDKAEQAHIYIAEGRLTEAKGLLLQIEERSPFEQLYLGLATEDREMIHHSHTRFINERSDFFFAILPLIELKRRGYANEATVVNYY